MHVQMYKDKQTNKIPKFPENQGCFSSKNKEVVFHWEAIFLFCCNLLSQSLPGKRP